MSYSNGLITFVFLLYLINIVCGLRTKSSSAPQNTEIAPHRNQKFFFHCNKNKIMGLDKNKQLFLIINTLNLKLLKINIYIIPIKYETQ